MIKQYRKRPVVIEAILFDWKNGKEIFDWSNGKVRPVPMSMTLDPTLWIDTLEGRMTADIGDYIIKGVKNEFYPCKPDIFAATYEEVHVLHAR